MEKREAIEILKDMTNDYHTHGVRYTTKIEALECAINTLENEGHWEEKHIKNAPMFLKQRWYCTACGEWQTHGKTRYCPNCGAEMEE